MYTFWKQDSLIIKEQQYQTSPNVTLNVQFKFNSNYIKDCYIVHLFDAIFHNFFILRMWVFPLKVSRVTFCPPPRGTRRSLLFKIKSPKASEKNHFFLLFLQAPIHRWHVQPLKDIMPKSNWRSYATLYASTINMVSVVSILIYKTLISI